MQLSRRDVMKLGILGGAVLYLPVERLARAKDIQSLTRLPVPFTLPFARPADIDLRSNTGLELTMKEVSAQILGPAPAWPATPLWAYVGPEEQVNPTLHVQMDKPVAITHVNALPAKHPKLGHPSDTSVHLHGSASLPQFDGYASDLIPKDKRKTYQYPNVQGARMLWYHDHALGFTAENTYSGLAAQYHLHDGVEVEKRIPQGTFDIPLTIRDALFDRDGSLLFDDNSHSSVMGDVILVNGVPWPEMPVFKRRYRFRVLNGSTSRSYRLSLSDPNAKMWVIASEGGYAPKPVPVSSVRMAMAERYEIIVDFTNCADNALVVLRNGDLPNNVRFANTDKVMRFKVAPGAAPDLSNNELPDSFYTPVPPSADPRAVSTAAEVMGLTAAMAKRIRRFEFIRTNGMWTVNGKTWEDVVASGFTEVQADPALGDIEIWEFVNNSGGWFHPIHVHLVDFKILSRNGRPPAAYEQIPKDTVYLGEGDTIRVIAKFGPHEGRYMIHCHNTVHEDHDMMTQYRVGPEKNPDPNDPRGTPAHP
jgi:spore coat protein A, manganese oxidase